MERRESLGNIGVERPESLPTSLEFLSQRFHHPQQALHHLQRHQPHPSYLSSASVSLHLTTRSGCTDALAPLVPDSSLCSASTHMERVPFPDALHLSSSSELLRKLQEDLTDEMVVLAKQLKESSLVMNQSLKNTEKILDSTEKAIEHSLASTGRANVRATAIYSESSKTSCLTWLVMFVMTCVFIMVILLIRVT